MPILVGANQQAPLFPPRVVEAPQVSFTDPLGRVTQFTDWEHGWVLQPGARGLDMPGYAFTTDESPGIDGHQVRQVRAQAKEIVLPVAFWCDDSRAAYLARRRKLIRSLNPKLGAGTLTVTHPDGETRSISCYYTSGMEGDESRDSTGMRWTMTTLTFSCPSPFWYGEPVEVSTAEPLVRPIVRIDPLLPRLHARGELLDHDRDSLFLHLLMTAIAPFALAGLTAAVLGAGVGHDQAEPHAQRIVDTLLARRPD